MNKQAVSGGCSCECCGVSEAAKQPMQRKEDIILAEGRQESYRLFGLDCADCAAALEKKLEKTTGVQAVQVNFGAGKLVIRHTLSQEAIMQAVDRAGYRAIPEGYEDTQQRSWQERVRVVATILSGVFLVAAFLAEWMFFSLPVAKGLYAATIISGGWHVARSAFYSLRSHTPDMNVLLLLAVIGAVLIGEWSEGATVVFLFALGNALQAYTLDKTRNSLRSLMQLAPRQACIRNGQEEKLVGVEAVQVGQVMIVRPGERVPMDGQIIRGISSIDQSAITGESMPVDKEPGQEVYAGTVNQDGVLEVAVSRLSGDSTLARIMHLVEEAQVNKAPIQQVVDRFARYYTPAVIAIAVGIGIILPFLLQQDFQTWFYRALVLLVIACPCALVISTPVSIVSAIGNASRNGVLIKGGAFLEKLGSIKVMAFDKTGTLTTGKAVVTDICPLAAESEEKLLIWAASGEQGFSHPVAQAVKDRAAGLPLWETGESWLLAGKGAQAQVAGKMLYLGNRRLFSELGHDLSLQEELLERWEGQGKSIMLVGTKDQLLGMLAVADDLREQCGQAIRSLRENGIEKIAMLTGDNAGAAKAIAGKVGVEQVYSQLLPADKVSTIHQLGQECGSIAMVGDGVNDAPALAAADIGISMGVAGSDAALETADIALMSDDLGKIPYVVRLSRKTVAVIRQNIALSLIIKVCFVLGTFGGLVNLWLAVFADVGASLLVTLNGMRLARGIRG